jgi:hypothetical protein
MAFKRILEKKEKIFIKKNYDCNTPNEIIHSFII